MLSHIVSQKNYIDMLFGCDKSLLRQSYLLLMLPYVRKIKVPEKVKFQRNKFRISLCDCPKEFSYIVHIKDIIRVQKKIISISDIPNSFRLRASIR
jgi:hypothetical protein